MTLSITDTQHNNAVHCAEFRALVNVKLSVIMLNVVALKDVKWKRYKTQVKKYINNNVPFWLSADVKTFPNDIVHVMPWKCMFILSMCA